MAGPENDMTGSSAGKEKWWPSRTMCVQHSLTTALVLCYRYCQNVHFVVVSLSGEIGYSRLNPHGKQTEETCCYRFNLLALWRGMMPS